MSEVPADAPRSQGAPEISGVAGAPEISGASSAPDPSSEPGASGAPDAPGEPGISDAPVVSGAPAAALPPGEEWRKLDKRTLLATAAVMSGAAAGAGVPTAAGLSGGMGVGRALAWVVPLALLLICVGTGGDYIRWLRTRYRIGPERADLHTGLLVVKRRSLARERIRTVDLTANLLLRVLGLVKVRIGTGEHSGDESTLELDSVTRAEGERLRTELLDRTSSAAGSHRDGMLADLDPGWIRYAPLSFVAPLLGGAAAGSVMQVSEWFGVQNEVIDWIDDLFRETSVVAMILVLVLAAGLAGLVGALGLWVEMWWNYRLEREPGGTLRVRRGLFTSRSVSIEERRLRGVELVEPLGVRLVGAARVDAVATGLADDDKEKHTDLKTLLPAAPRAVADEVAARVLRESESPTNTALLIPHPVAARGRRLRWAVGSALLPVVVLAALGLLLTDVLLYIAAACAVVGLPVAVLLALDAYRNLGHAISGGYLVARSGTVRRSTVALQRGGIIGWTVKQSYFQRGAGLLTLTATTAAGSGGYDIYDAAQGEGLAFAETAVPDLLTPFLEPEG